MNKPVAEVKKLLKANGDESVRQGNERFFKEPVISHGVRGPMVNKISRQVFRQIKGQPKQQIFVMCETLWQSGYLEECGIACQWAYCLHGQYETDDIEVFDYWLEKYVRNWASCDTLCNHAVGALVEAYPPLLARLEQWAVSPNRWKRRAAAVSLIIPGRQGLFLEQILKLAQILLHDGDDMVQKGYGWMLKAASQAHARNVFEFVMTHKHEMPRTSLRYALEKMPKDWRAQAMAK